MGREVRMVPKDWQHPIRPSLAKRGRAPKSADTVVDLVLQADGCYGEPRMLGTGTFDPNADYVPLFGDSWREHAEAWEGEFRLYKQGLWLSFSPDSFDRECRMFTAYDLDPLPDEETAKIAACRGDEGRLREAFGEWHGEKHAPEEHMPDWPAEERTHYQMYETCSEGTPISPVMETPDALARWLAEHNASAFGSMTASYESWLATVHRGCPIGFVIEGNKITSGPAFMARSEN